MLAFRRIPAILVSYRFMSKVCRDWKEALFIGYFGPIGMPTISPHNRQGLEIDIDRNRCHILR